MIEALETRWQPNITLIDSRAGIDEIASSIVTDLGASLVLLFAVNGTQTWSGYRVLFQHWRKTGSVNDIRNQLQIVAAMIPEVNSSDYSASLRENAWSLFTEEVYDEIKPPTNDAEDELSTIEEPWNFDLTNEEAPHYPLPVRWNRGFAALENFYDKMELDQQLITTIFGGLIKGVNNVFPTGYPK